MADKPILFSGPMVRALLAGTKTQTRRIIKPQPPADVVRHCWYSAPIYGFTKDQDVTDQWHTVRLLGYKGDHLWVKETWSIPDAYLDGSKPDLVIYRATPWAVPGAWRPSIFMRRWASRLTLTITDVRVERLQDISNDDGYAEGISRDFLESIHGPGGYRDLWESINGAGSWEANPWVVAYTFDVHRCNIDQMAKEAA